MLLYVHAFFFIKKIIEPPTHLLVVRVSLISVTRVPSLLADTLVDKAMDLDHIGGTYGGSRKPSKFLCLVLKMLQIQPEKEIVIEFIKNDDHKLPCLSCLSMYLSHLRLPFPQICSCSWCLLPTACWKASWHIRIFGTAVCRLPQTSIQEIWWQIWKFPLHLPPTRHALAHFCHSY